MPDPTPKRGAQPGNRNAAGPGFYARARLTAARTELLADARQNGSLADDVALLRMEIATMVRVGGYDGRTLAAIAKAIVAAELAAHKMTGGDDRNAMMDALNAVLADVQALGGTDHASPA